MRNTKNHADRCEKQSFSKCDGVCKTYSAVQTAYAEMLEQDSNVKEFRCNVPLTDFELPGSYTTDFVCIFKNGDMMVRECIKSTHIYRPQKIKMLDASREYWAKRGITDWGIVIDA